MPVQLGCSQGSDVFQIGKNAEISIGHEPEREPVDENGNLETNLQGLTALFGRTSPGTSYFFEDIFATMDRGIKPYKRATRDFAVIARFRRHNCARTDDDGPHIQVAVDQ